MGGSTKQTSRTSQTTSMPKEQRENYRLLMGGAQDLFNSGGPQYFPGANYTTPTGNQLQGRQMAADYAGGVGQELVNNAIGANNFWMDPNNLFNLQNIPGYGATRQGIVTDVTRNLTENILPQTRGSAITGGGLGGSRQQQAEALASGRTSGELAQALGNLDLGMYGQNLQANQAAIGRAPAMFQLGTQPADVFNRVGAAERMDTAEQIAGDKERWDFEQNRFPKLLAMLQALTGSAGQYGGTTKGTQTTEQSGGGWQQALGGALTLGSLLMGNPAAAAGIGGMFAGGGIDPYTMGQFNTFGNMPAS
jgi:hypothetical protein